MQLTLQRSPTAHKAQTRQQASPRAFAGRIFQAGPPLPPVAQAKLRVNAPNDKYEREADRVTEGVVSGGVVTIAKRPGAPPRLQGCASSPPSACPGHGAPAVVGEVLRSPGRPLDTRTRQLMEPRLGVDLSVLRVHTNALAARSARSVNALALTVGTDIMKPLLQTGSSRGAPVPPEKRFLINSAAPKAPFLQPKLKIGSPNDRFEHEADRVAAEVMRMPESRTVNGAGITGSASLPGIQRGCRECEEEASIRPQVVQRMCSPCEEELHRRPLEEKGEEGIIQAKEGTGRTPEVTADVQAQINGLRGAGEPLPEPVRAFFEPRFDFDFSQVRVHADGGAARAARSLNARAFAFGRDIVFGRGEYAPKTTSGKNLLAHELCHVVQQQRSGRLNIQMARLRDYGRRSIQPSVRDLENTNEFKAYMNPGLIWQWQLHVTREEALLATLIMLDAIRQGDKIIWSTHARVFIMRARAALALGKEFRRFVEQTFVEPIAKGVELLPVMQEPIRSRRSVDNKCHECGEWDEREHVFVFKGKGLVERIPEEKKRFIDERQSGMWAKFLEARFMAKGHCHYVIFRVKSLERTGSLSPSLFPDLKWEITNLRVDGRMVSNNRTGEVCFGGQVSTELSITDKVGPLRIKAAGVVGSNMVPVGPGKLKLALFVRGRVEAAAGVGPASAGVRFPVLNCRFGEAEISNNNVHWKFTFDKCWEDIRKKVSRSVSDVEIITPRIIPPQPSLRIPVEQWRL